MNNEIDNKKRYKHILTPCPSYDIEGMESWLECMASKGFILNKDGFFLGFATFEISKPSVIRYRMEPAPKNIGLLSDSGTEPSQEEIEISELYDWKYIATVGQFYIFCSESKNSRELNTDSRVQALALDLARSRERSNLISSVILLVFYIFMYFIGSFMLMVLNLGSVIVALAVVLMICSYSSSISHVIYLRKLHKKLISGEEPNRKKNWEKYAFAYRLKKMLYPFAILVLVVLIANCWMNDVSDYGIQVYDGTNGDFPFSTMRDLAPEGKYTLKDFYKTNCFKINSDLLAPTIVEFRESATITKENGQKIEGGLYIDYYETAFEWIAKRVAYEYIKKAQKEGHYTELQIEDLKTDYSFAYIDYMPTVIIQSGKKIMRVSFYQTSENYTIDLNVWAKIFADSIK